MGVHYRPILAGRQGEFEALGHLSPERWRVVTPLMELTQRVRPNRAPFGPGDRRPTARETSGLFRDKVLDYFTTNMHLAVDAAAVQPDDSLPPGLGVLGQLVTDVRMLQVPVIPVVRLGDGAALADLGRIGPDQGVIIRLRQSDLVRSIGDLLAWVRAVQRVAGVKADGVDLLLDLGPVRTTTTSALLDSPLIELMRMPGWRSRTIAGGAFPRDLTGVPEWELTEIPRRDAALWCRIRDGLAVDVDFGDYAVAHPAAASRGSAPPPQLRYAVDRRWLVVKGPRHQAHQFFEVCRRIRGHPEFSTLGAADRLIARRAGEGPAGGLTSGSGSTWRALSTAHHLDHVSEHLLRTGAP